MISTEAIDAATAQFGVVLRQQLERVERLKQEGDWVDYSSIRPIVIGMIGGDGIGPTISEATQRVLERLLSNEVAGGKVKFRTIEGLTIENRAAQMKSIPDDVLAEIRECDVTLKGPTHTPEKGDKWPNIESANVSMRKELDLFANVRPRADPEGGHRLDLLPGEYRGHLRGGQPGGQRDPGPRRGLPGNLHAGLPPDHRRCVRPRQGGPGRAG